MASNDDTVDKGYGLVTHHADSYLQVRLPGNGHYYVQLSDAQSHGGDDLQAVLARHQQVDQDHVGLRDARHRHHFDPILRFTYQFHPRLQGEQGT